MELLVTLGFLIALAVLAPRFGYDSREGVQSNEEQLACSGLKWGPAPPLAPRPPKHRLRHVAARLLLAIARWLNPELSRAGI